MPSVLDRIVPGRRADKEKLRQLDDDFDSRFGDCAISAPTQGGWAQTGQSRQTRHEWDHQLNKPTTQLVSEDGYQTGHDGVFIVDDTYSPQTVHERTFAIPQPFSTRRSHSRNASLNEILVPYHNAKAISPATYTNITDTYLQEYARLPTAQTPNVGPWNYVHEQPELSRSPQPQPGRNVSNSPPALAHSPASLELSRAKASSPAVSILSPVSEDFARDDPRSQQAQQGMQGIGLVPLQVTQGPHIPPPPPPLMSRNSPQPPQVVRASPPSSDSEQFQWQRVPIAPFQQSATGNPVPRTRARSNPTDPGYEPISRAQSVPNAPVGRSSPSAYMMQKPWARSRTPSTQPYPLTTQFHQYTSESQAQMRQSLAISRPSTAGSFRGGLPPRPSQSHTLVDHQQLQYRSPQTYQQGPDYVQSAYPYALFEERPQSRGMRGASRARAQSEDPADRVRGRTRSASRNARAASRDPSPRRYMTFEDHDPEPDSWDDQPAGIPLPPSRNASRPGSRAVSRTRAPSRGPVERSQSRAQSRGPLDGRPRAPSRTGSARPHARLPFAATDASYYDASDADAGTGSSSSEEIEGYHLGSGFASRRPSIATTTMSTNGGSGICSTHDYRAAVTAEAEFLLRTIRGDCIDADDHNSTMMRSDPDHYDRVGGAEDLDRDFVHDHYPHYNQPQNPPHYHHHQPYPTQQQHHQPTPKPKTGKFRDVVKSPFSRGAQVVPDGEELWA